MNTKLDSPSCATCPFMWAAPDGNNYCRRYPPVTHQVAIPVSSLPKEQQLRLPAEVARSGYVQGEQSKFPTVLPVMVCGEHPDFDDGCEDEPEPQGKIALQS